jgi:hypothetical protein
VIVSVSRGWPVIFQAWASVATRDDTSWATERTDSSRTRLHGRRPLAQAPA